MISNQNYKVLRAFGHEAHVIVASEQTKGAFCIVRFFHPGRLCPIVAAARIPRSTSAQISLKL
jgi:hypothetical protein